MKAWLKEHPIEAILVFSLMAKLALANWAPVFGDETYYYIWSLHPQLSYPDHPAMVSWLIRLGHFVFPEGHPLGLRLAFVLASVATTWLWVKILRLKNGGTREILIFLALYFLNPLLGPGAVVATPDTPLVLFWTLSYYCFLRLIAEKKLIWYAGLGAALGLGFCSKYHIVLFVFSGLIWLALSKEFRRLRPAGVLLTVFFGAVFSLPVVIWNAQNDWASFLFQMNHGFGESSFEPGWALNYVAAQIALVNPVVFLALFKKDTGADRIFSLSQLGFFLTSAFRSIVEGNWPITSHLHSTANFSRQKPSSFRWALLWAAVLYTAVTIFLLSPASRKARKNVSNSAQLGNLVPLVENFKPLYGPSYQFASLLTWKTQVPVPKLSGLSRRDFYDSLPESVPTAKEFFVLKNDYSEWPAQYDHYNKIKLQYFNDTGLELYQFDHE